MILFQTFRCLFLSSECYIVIEFFLTQFEIIVNTISQKKMLELIEMIFNHMELFSETKPYSSLLYSCVSSKQIDFTNFIYFQKDDLINPEDYIADDRWAKLLSDFTKDNMFISEYRIISILRVFRSRITVGIFFYMVYMVRKNTRE